MEQNNDKRIVSNDILKEASEAKGAEAIGSMDGTIEFRREPSQPRTGFRMGANAPSRQDSPTQRPDLENTAQIRGGAVVRPLKQQTPQKQSKSAASQGQSRVQPQSAQTNKTPSKGHQQTAPVTHTGAQSRPTSQIRPAGAASVPHVQPSVRSTQSPPVTPKPMPTRTVQPPLNRSGVKPTQASVNRPVNNPPINGGTMNSHPGAVSINQKSGSTAPNLQSVKRTENDDFEIDEATYNRELQRRLRRGNKPEKFDRAGDAASSAIMSLVKAMIYIVAVILVSIGLSMFVINTANDIFKFQTDERIVSVTIPEYASIDDVADALYDAGVIKYKWSFKLWSNLKDSGAEFIAGTYDISTSLNYDYLRASFKKSFSRDVVRITIPEGYTIDEMIDLFVEENGIGTREGFIDVINNYEFTGYRFIDELTVTDGRFYRLEGYLFPDTYDFYKDSSELTVITKLLDNFNRKFVSEYYDRASQLGMTVDQAIALASMIEKEAHYADDLGGVSSVFHNRLKYAATFPYLNSDATIMYAIAHDTGSRQETMTSEDTKYDSIYNTYTHRGLPPSAIANPGLNSIKYALYPNDTDYFYFVSDARGRMLYAKTEQEHLKNINTVRGN